MAGILLAGCGNSRPKPKFSHPENGIAKLPFADWTGYIPYKNGKRHGVAKFYDKKGRLVKETTFVNGVVDGTVKTWSYNNGELRSYSITPYKNGKKHGIYRSYYGNGKPDSVYGYENGKFSGIHNSYNENGTVYTLGRYSKKGEKKIGTWIENFENGNKWRVSKYTYVKDKDGKEHQVIYIKEYVGDGSNKIKQTGVIRDGKIISRKLSPALKRQMEREDREIAAMEKREAAAKRKKYSSTSGSTQLKCRHFPPEGFKEVTGMAKLNSMARVKGEGVAEANEYLSRHGGQKPSRQGAMNYCTKQANIVPMQCYDARAFVDGRVQSFGY